MASNQIFLLAIVLIAWSVSAQDTVEQRLETIFGNATAVADNSSPGFDVIVQPDPIVEVRTLPVSILLSH